MSVKPLVHATSRGEERFWKLATPLLDKPGVTRSTMMGLPCLRLDGDFFAASDRRSGDLLVKLDENRATLLVDEGKAEPFAPNGRRFREWVSIPDRFARRWPALLEEALQSAAMRQSSPQAGRPQVTPHGGTLGRRGRSALDRVRSIALALPEVNERLSHGEPCFFVRDRRPLCYFHDNHNGDGRVSLWCRAPTGVPEELVGAEPQRFFRPTPSARGTFSTWLGVYLDTIGANRVDWNEIAAIITDAYRNIAPNQLIAMLDGRKS